MTDTVEALEPAPETVPPGDGRALPFGYAKDNGVLLDTSREPPVVYHSAPPAMPVIIELRRIIGGPFQLEAVNDTEFQRRLSLAYQRLEEKRIPCSPVNTFSQVTPQAYTRADPSIIAITSHGARWPDFSDITPITYTAGR